MKRAICIVLVAMILIIDVITGHCINISSEERNVLIEKAFSSKVTSYVEILTYADQEIKGVLKKIKGTTFYVINKKGQIIIVNFDDIEKINFGKNHAYDTKKLLKGICYGTGLGLLFFLVMAGLGMNSAS